MATTDMKLKLMVNKTTNRVVFAEAPKDVADVLFGLLQTPLGTIVNLVTKEKMAGSIGNVLGSVSMDANFFYVKSGLLNPVGLYSTTGMRLLLPPATPNTDASTYKYCCGCGNSHECRGSTQVRNTKAKEIPRLLVNCYVTSGGYVKEMVYTVTDDLTVAPMSSTSIFMFLNKHKIKDVNVLQEKVVEFGFDQGLEVLRASLQSKTVLSDVFLSPKAAFLVPKSEADQK